MPSSITHFRQSQACFVPSLNCSNARTGVALAAVPDSRWVRARLGTGFACSFNNFPVVSVRVRRYLSQIRRSVCAAADWQLTIHSSRSRFAARLNSGVRHLSTKVAYAIAQVPKVRCNWFGCMRNGLADRSTAHISWCAVLAQI
jgi:hypothetical protein